MSHAQSTAVSEHNSTVGSHGVYLDTLTQLQQLAHPLGALLLRAAGDGTQLGSPCPGPAQDVGTHMMSNPASMASGASQREEPPSSLHFHFPLPRGNVPPARWAHAAAAVGNVLWVYGGVGNAVLDDLACLEADTLTWRNVGGHAARSKDRPDKMLGHAMAASGNKLWLFGGQQGRKFLRTLYSLDTETCSWTRVAAEALPAARAGHAMATVHGSVVYLFGGQGKKLYNDMYKLDPVAGNFVEVEAAGKPPTPRRGHSLCWDGRDYLVCFGGINQSSTDSNLSVFSLSRGQWFTPQAFGPTPSARTQHSAVMLSPGIIMVFGGCNSAGTFFNDTTVLDTRTMTWSKPALLNTPPAPRYHHTCAVINGRIIVYGGINSKQTFDGVVVIETRFLSDISSVAEELFRMSADQHGLVGGAVGAAAPLALHSAHSTVGALASAVAAAMPLAAASPLPAASPALAASTPSATPTHQQAATHQLHLQQQLQAAAAAAHHHPQPAPAPLVIPGPSVSTAEMLLNSSKSLDNVKVQLTDLLLRRNLEEQQLQTARKAETAESLLAKERESHEAAAKELMQHRLLLAEAESQKHAAQQQLAALTAKATRESAAVTELRAHVESLQAKLSSREEELQEARLLQDGLVKELGIMASRYSRLAMDVQAAGGAGAHAGGSAPARAEGASGSSGPLGSAGGRRASLSHPAPMSLPADRVAREITLAEVTAVHAQLLGAGLGRGGAGGVGSSGMSLSDLGHGTVVRLGSSAGDGPGTQQQGALVEDARDEDDSSPLVGISEKSMFAALRQGGAAGPGSAGVGGGCPGRPQGAGASGGTAGGSSVGCSNCCSQLLVLLSESEVHRSALLEANHGLSDKVEALKASNRGMQAQLRELLADAAALEALPLAGLEELERRLESSARAVREVSMRRKIEEAHRRTSSEQAQCAVCMEAPKGVVFNCGHQACEPCAGKMTSCPFCRVAITARIRLFDA